MNVSVFALVDATDRVDDLPWLLRRSAIVQKGQPFAMHHLGEDREIRPDALDIICRAGVAQNLRL